MIYPVSGFWVVLRPLELYTGRSRSVSAQEANGKTY